MKTLDKYIGQAIISGVGVVLIIFISIMGLFAFAAETDKIGQADYTLFEAIKYTLSLMPQHIYEIFPLSMLLGTMLGLGWLANHNELIIIRMAGVSLIRIIGSIMKTALMLMVLAMIIGEGIAPPLHQYASEQRVKLLNKQISLNTDYGLWARDGETYIHVNRVENDGRLVGITLYQFNNENIIERRINAHQAIYTGEYWELQAVSETRYQDGAYTMRSHKSLPWTTLLDRDMVNIVAIPPDLLSIWKLDSYIDYLKNNDLDHARYELVYWIKIFAPITLLAMVLLAVPFVFGSVRQVSIGKQILFGFLVGISFYIGTRLIGQVGLVYDVPPVLSAILPTLIVLSLTLWSYRRIR